MDKFSTGSDTPKIIVWILIVIVILVACYWLDFRYRKWIVQEAIREDRQEQGKP